MNKDLYKLVYSQVLNMMVPVSEAARSRNARSSKRVRKALKSLLTFTFLISYSFIGNSWADTVLPAGLSVQTMVGTQIKSSGVRLRRGNHGHRHRLGDRSHRY